MSIKPGTNVERASDRELLIRRFFRAQPKTVFDAMTQPELVRRWWAPKSLGVFPGRIFVSDRRQIMSRIVRLSLEAFAVLAVFALPAQASIPEFSDVGMVAAPVLAAGAYLIMRARKK